MLVLELLNKNLAKLDHDRHTVRSYATRDDLPYGGTTLPSRRLSVLHIVHAGLDDFPVIRRHIASMLFKEVVVVLQLDRSRDDWKALRDAVVRIRKYMAIEIVQISETERIEEKGIIQLCSIERDQVLWDSCIGIDPEDVYSMFASVRDPKRKLAIARTEYYRTPNAEPAIGRLRDLQHLNMLAYLQSEHGVSFDFGPDHSLIEIGPGAGFVYRFAQSKGLHDICVIDKNEAFCALASIDEVPVILNHDLSDSGFCDSFRTACPDGADYFLAKGILNIYSHTETSQYRAVVDLLTRSIRSAGVWIPYNVDRANGHRSDLLELSESAFREAGWTKIDVPVSLHRLIGIDYPSEVHSGLWVHRGVD